MTAGAQDKFGWPEVPRDERERVGEAAYWDGLYASGEDGWELGAASPPLARAARALGDGGGGGALVLGCGRGHEARLLASLGWRVTAVDFAPRALAEARRLSETDPPGWRIEWRLADLFTLGETDAARFDLVLEHTCFCAISPARRLAWAKVVGAVLRPAGRLLGLFYAHGRPGGPPFTTTREEVVAALESEAGLTVLESETPPDSIERRRGLEVLLLARKPAT